MLKPAYDKLLVLALATPVLVLTVLLARSPSKGDGGGVTPQFWAERRAAARIEARLTHPEADKYRPRVSSGGCPVPPEPIPLKELAKLEEVGDWGGIAAAYALQGEWNQAASFLERMPASPNRDSDLAAVHLARGAHEQALRLLDAVLAAHPKHAQALWNRALVLQEMGLTMKASETYEQVATLNEQGWGRDAHAHALALREETLERARKWKGARDATLALMEDPRAPLPLEEARQQPGVVRQSFYDVVRSAQSKERALALLPLAQELDRLQGGSTLGDYVRKVATRDFTRRAPLAKGYAELVRTQGPVPEALLETLRASSEDDLFAGALLRTRGNAMGYVADAVERGRRQQDPWFNFYLEREQARKETADGEWWKAEQRLFSALQRCREGAFSAGCVELELRLGILYAGLRRLTEAEQHARTGWTWARQLREWELELTSLENLTHIARDRGDFSSARAYVEEWSARGGRKGASLTCYWPQIHLAHIHYLDMRPEDARRALEAATACPSAPLDVVFGATFAEMARARPAPGDAEQLRQVLAATRVSNPTPGDAVYAHYIEGRFALDREHAQGQALLERVISDAQKLPRADTMARESWTLSYSSLVTDAGRTGDYPRVLELMAAQLGTSVPERCALAAAVHHERAVVVARGPQGQVEGAYEGNRQEPFSRSPTSKLVPEKLRQVLRGCERVDVLAWAPVFGRTDLLPPDMAWSFRMGKTAQPRTASSGRRLVVSSVEAPSLLQLPRLPSWTPSPEPEPTPPELLSGSEATPSRVLSSMADATEIEIHAHGISDPALSDASLVVLSPEGNGRYALTADIVRQQKLAGAPLVFLAACSAGRLASSSTHEPFSLPAAFIDAGARAVLASTVDIPDAAGRFFDGVRQRIRAGSTPAVALRDERQKWLARDSRNAWTQFVLLVETSQ
ncbi:CHAT domain-containing protein [Pyxidicoccus sp. MSG2]|uniref:CHAT domain-containing protein n=1 Tax=Pyxidicoccus sp. MSG2 TaxID=2996790 RepID=UPI00227058F5|nr:CHAT domain-containing protein [Pyxidicoccus sp. MSG2]MCY1016943.1 CHAT domain-containing protein [Pyxidicoccus sp. MSG2]